MSDRKLVIISSEPVGWPESPMYGLFQRIQSNILADNGYKIILISPQGRSLKFGLNLSHNKENHNNSFTLLKNSLPNIFRINRNLESLAFAISGLIIFFRNRKLLERTEIYHFHNIYNAGILFKFLSYLGFTKNAKSFLTEHTSYVHSGRAPKFLTRYILRSTDLHISAVSLSLKTVLEQYTSKVYLLHNPVEEIFEKPLKIKDRLAQICIVGALEPIKNHSLLFESLELIDFPLKVAIVGDGSLRKKLKALFSKLPLNIEVTFFGYQNPENVKTIMKNSMALISVSLSETFGVVLIESLSQGTPVISTLNGGCLDIVTDEVGILCNFERHEIANAISKVVMEKKFDNKKIREYFNKKFSTKAYLENLEKFYEL